MYNTELDKVAISTSWGGIIFSADEKYLYVSDVTPFKALPALVNLKDINPGNSKLIAMSKGLDFSKEDTIPD